MTPPAADGAPDERPADPATDRAPEPAPAPLDDRALAAFVERWAPEAELVYPGVPTPTVPAAAEALGVAPDAIVKSLVFRADDRPWLVIAAGSARVSMRLLAAALGVSRRRLQLAPPEAALRISGYPVGAMPPFGHRRPLPTLVDAATVPASGTVYGGGGDRAALLKLDVATLLRVTGARRLPLSEAAAADPPAAPERRPHQAETEPESQENR